MICHVFWTCLTLPWVVMCRADALKDMTEFRKCAQEELCDAPLAELAPYGSLLCLAKCLQLASCSHVVFSSKTLVCRTCMASSNVPAGKRKTSESDEDWMCRKKVTLVPCSECQPGSTCVKSRSGETKCVHYDLQEHLEGKGRMSTQQRNAKLLKMTKQDFKDNWTTTKILGSDKIIALTYSPSFANELYSLSKKGSHFIIALFMLKGNSLEKKVRWDNVRLPSKNRVYLWESIDTGPCLTSDNMSCIYAFRNYHSFNELVMHLRSYREVKSPRNLELEKEGDITQSLPTSSGLYMFASRGKFGMVIYCNNIMSSRVEKYLIQTGEGEFTLKESGTVSRLWMAKHIKWNNDASFAIATDISSTIYFIRRFDDKEQVEFSVRVKWYGNLSPVWTKTSILVLETERLNLLHIRTF